MKYGKIRAFRQTWLEKPRDEKGRWVKTGTTLSKAIKNTTKRDKIKESRNTRLYDILEKKYIQERDELAKIASDRLANASIKVKIKPIRTSKKTLENAIASTILKRESSKLDKDFNEIYKPSPEVLAKINSKNATVKGIDRLIDKEAHEPFIKIAKATLIRDGEDFSSKDVKDLAYDYATNSREREYKKIKEVTKEEYIFKTSKGIIELDTEDTYQAQWINQYKIKDDEGNLKDKGFFRTAEELKKILK